MEPSIDPTPFLINPWEATERIKGFTFHLGADLVGICRVNPLWVYSHRGEIFYNNWEDWGQEIHPSLPFAFVISTEMAPKLVEGAPNPPSVGENCIIYAKGAFISTVLANFIAPLGDEGPESVLDIWNLFRTTGGATGGRAPTAGGGGCALEFSSAGEGKGRHHALNFFTLTFGTDNFFRDIKDQFFEIVLALIAMVFKDWHN